MEKAKIKVTEVNAVPHFPSKQLLHNIHWSPLKFILDTNLFAESQCMCFLDMPVSVKLFVISTRPKGLAQIEN